MNRYSLIWSNLRLEQLLEAYRNSTEHIVPRLARFHIEFEGIHPFIDGNGRTSRLLMNLYLLRHGYVIITLKGSNDAKVNYYKALEMSHTEQLPEDFQKLVIEAEIAALQKYLSIMA